MYQMKKRRFKQVEPPKQKKVKLSVGPDIPSINLIANQKTKLVGNKAQLLNKSQITSVPFLPLKQEKDATKVLYKMHIPDKFKEVLGPNVEELKRFDMQQKKKQAQLSSMIRKGIIPDPKLQKLHQQLREQTELIQENKQMPESVSMDERGVTRDSKGNQITMNKKLVSSLKVNLKKEKEEKVKQMLKKHTRGVMATSSKFFDQNLRIMPRIKKEKKRSQAFQFIEKGSILKKTQSEVDTDKSTSIPYGLKRVTVKIRHHDPIPDIEWWDVPVLPETSKNYTDAVNYEMYEIRNSAISNMIEHPPTFKTSGMNVNVSVPMYLTKEERKKIRRKKAMEKQKEMQDKIKLGLMKPPPPKVKMSNLMRVLGPEAVADPSRIEKEVKKNIQDRLKNHLQRNKANKLTKEQKTEKWLRKLKRFYFQINKLYSSDSAIECRVAVFRIEKVTSKAIKFKLDKNAQEYALHGICLISDSTVLKGVPSLVIVEGGPKAIKQYKKLILKRIQWHKIEDESVQQQLKLQPNQMQAEDSKKKKWATLIWEGVIKDHLFKKWQVFEFKSEMEGKRYLTEKGVDYYWDMVLTYEMNMDKNS